MVTFQKLPSGFAAMVLLGVFLIADTGCESPSGSRATESADAAGPSTARDVVTFFDRESLQAGVGPVDSDISRDFQTTASGLKYRLLRNSEGVRPKATDTVEVHYRGWLDSGRQFDNSYDRGKTTSFPLNGVIPGWT